ncbi:MAG: Hint domain-containing protein, partial [Pseudomonadota bacterium]
VRVSTTLTITNGGNYRFDLGSDDGSRLYVDGVEVVENDGLHAFRTENGTVNLSPGQHEIVIIFFERGGQAQLQAAISGPDYPLAVPLQNAAVQANAGADRITGSSGDDSIVTGAGNDVVSGGSGENTINAGTGNDSVFGGTGDDSILGGAGQDRIEGRAGSDTILGGGGADTITGYDAISVSTGNVAVQSDDGSGDSLAGGGGSDRVFGGRGDDTIDGGSGNDSLSGGDDDDVISGGSGDDTILGGTGADTIDDASGTNVIDGGEGDDSITVQGLDNQTVTGGTGDDFVQVFVGSGATATIEGGSGNDTLLAGDSTDTIDGGTGNDEIDVGGGDDVARGSGGDDEIRGFDGADTLQGDDGNDTIDGGDGNDELTGGDGFDVFTVSSGDDVITDFNTGAGQDFDDGTQANNDFIDLSPFYTDIFEARRDIRDDGILNQSNTGDADYSDNTALPGSITLSGVAAEDVTEDNVNLMCFAAGTRIRTPSGEVRVEDLVEGDLVETLDQGAQPIRWAGSRTVPARGRLAPVVIAAGALGNAAELRVSPQHRMLLSGWRLELAFGVDGALVPAINLVNDRTIRQVEGGEVTYHHILFDQHEIVFAAGAPSESFHPGKRGLDGLTGAARDEILDLFPDLRGAPDGYGPSARVGLKGYEGHLISRDLLAG